MIKFKTKIKDFSIPTNWNDVIFKDYLRLQNSNEIEALKILTGLNEIELQLIDIEEIVPYIEFLQSDISQIEPLNFINDTILPGDIGECTFEDKILACRNIDNIVKVISIYSKLDENDILNASCENVFSAYNYLILQLKVIIERDNGRLKSDITVEQKQAGIDMFNELGDFNTIDMIAEKYKYSHSEVEQLSYNLIFLILLKQNISSKFESNYTKLMRNDN
ncbi:hypothetical protein UFOVP600_12 [uncultured Caudovirales phage]|uniref:Uncharacterized protein n=1 Tax=uncultured Caudovirales phage TaxID=2100421 RepID=A0A6J5N220_9CAUD|nr:hypothetical protein UFOVP600_12 [uncultured Caudovirales phage]